MQTKQFITRLDNGRIVEAIGSAEKLSSGEIRVFVAKKKIDDPVRAAQIEFHRMRMDRTALRNGVLLFIAPESQSFAIVGDQGIHEKCGQAFWCEVAEAMRASFVADDFTTGVIRGIEAAGKALAQHFPRSPDDVNELPDQVEQG
jgi:uncharacterized membrane protein